MIVNICNGVIGSVKAQGRATVLMLVPQTEPAIFFSWVSIIFFLPCSLQWDNSTTHLVSNLKGKYSFQKIPVSDLST